jgi:xanthine dehydrogenase accessory factor
VKAANETVEVFEEAVNLQRQGQPCVLATVISSRGSSPRKAGAKMLVRGDGSSVGTIGGGKVEFEIIAASLAALSDGTGSRTETMILDEKYGHACGGELTVYLEPLMGMPRLIVCGGGHVGQAVTALASFAGFRVCVIDDRPEMLTEARLPEACCRMAGDYAESVCSLGLTGEDFVVIATPCYPSDFAAAWAALETPARFIGMIGSRRKKKTLLSELTAAGATETEVARIIIPVGLAIGGNSLQEIAVSIVAQLIERRYCD